MSEHQRHQKPLVGVCVRLVSPHSVEDGKLTRCRIRIGEVEQNVDAGCEPGAHVPQYRAERALVAALSGGCVIVDENFSGRGWAPKESGLGLLHGRREGAAQRHKVRDRLLQVLHR